VRKSLAPVWRAPGIPPLAPGNGKQLKAAPIASLEYDALFSPLLFSPLEGGCVPALESLCEPFTGFGSDQDPLTRPDPYSGGAIIPGMRNLT
jgi:hypothetical protein